MARREHTAADKHEWAPLIKWEMSRLCEELDTVLAHVVMLAVQGILSTHDAKMILSSLVQLGDQGAQKLDLEGNEMCTFVTKIESFLAKHIGPDLASSLNIGRSRIDQTATVARLSARPKLLKIMEAIISLQNDILTFATSHTGVLVPYHTHMQHSQPGTIAHFMLAYFFRLQTDLKACKDSFSELNCCPLGTAGRCGTSWDIDRDLTSQLLGFNKPIIHSLLGRDPDWALGTTSAISRVMFTLGDLATDFQLWLCTEFGYATLDKSHCGTSSIFPQKVNPLTTDTIRAASGSAGQWFANAYTRCRGMGTADHLIRQVPDLESWLTTTHTMTCLMSEIIPALTIQEDRLRSVLADSWAGATNLVDILSRNKSLGLTYREAHNIVAEFVRSCKNPRVAREAVTHELFTKAVFATTGKNIDISFEEMTLALDAQNFVDSCISTGSVGPGSLVDMKKMAELDITMNNAWIVTMHDTITRASAKLRETIECFICLEQPSSDLHISASTSAGGSSLISTRAASTDEQAN